MTENGTQAFLQQAHRNNWQQYLASLAPTARRGWDVCVLTASDEQQAAMYARQLALRRQVGLLPAHTHFVVVADPPGQRIGSGGATLRVLRLLQDPAYVSSQYSGVGAGLVPAQEGDHKGTPLHFEKIPAYHPIHHIRPPDDAGPLPHGRTLVIHSGGDSRRLPHCSAVGKLFARIPHALPDGRASTLFDEFLVSLSGVPLQLNPGVLVASGDVLLVFDHLQLGLQQPGVTGVAAAAPAEIGTHHGVYVCDDHTRRLRAYLHKPDAALLRQWDAMSTDGMVDIDTGLVWLDEPTVSRLVTLADKPEVAVFCRAQPPGQPLPAGLNLYGDLLLPLAESTAREDYLADTSDGPDTPAVRRAREAIWDRLRSTPFAVERLQPAAFLHFGTSHEYWTLLAHTPEMGRLFGWTQQTGAWVPAPAGQTPPVAMNAVVGGHVIATAPVLVSDSCLDGKLSVSGPALIAGLHTTQSLDLQAGVVVHQLPVAGGFVTRVYGLHDDPKYAVEMPEATFVNRSWASWLDQAGITPGEIWPDAGPAERTLWNARLYPLAADREASLSLSLPLQDPAHAPAGWRARWQNSRRLSLAESFHLADGDRILAEITAVEDEVAARAFCAAVVAETPAARAVLSLGTDREAMARRVGRVDGWLEHQDPLVQLRGAWTLAQATGEANWETRAFDTLAGMIERSVHSQRRGSTYSPQRNEPAGPAGRTVRVEAAARIDLGGGWTDTPPYSIERGGMVLNAAVTLQGRYPIVVEAEWLPELRIVLQSHDIGATIEPVRLGEVLACANPADPFALLKAALVMRGIVPGDGDPEQPVQEILDGRGLRLCTQTIIPRGSGLGTSSILAGAVLSCLARWQGSPLAQERLFDEVLCLEQMLTTGGGWQDQVGGLTGGIKLVTTPPGLPQRITVTPLCLSPETKAELATRLVLVYTGQQRLAKNLLQRVMGRWMAREPEMVWILDEIARLAQAMRDALEAGDVDEFGRLLGEHWILNKRMDPGCSNPFIDQLFTTMEPYIQGGKLAGAGGGGFAIIVTQSRDETRHLSGLLQARFAGAPTAVWPCAIPTAGMLFQ